MKKITIEVSKANIEFLKKECVQYDVDFKRFISMILDLHVQQKNYHKLIYTSIKEGK